MASSRRSAAETRQAILDTAAQLFDQRGYRATSIDDITKELGLTKGAMYFHFKSKGELAQEITRAYTQTWDPLLERVDQEGMRGLDALAWVSKEVAHAYRRDTIIRAAVRLHRESHEIEVELPQPFVHWMSVSRRFLEEDLDDGLVREDVDVERAAWHIVATFFGTQDVSNQLHGRKDLEDRVETMWELVLGGVRPAGAVGAAPKAAGRRGSGSNQPIAVK